MPRSSSAAAASGSEPASKAAAKAAPAKAAAPKAAAPAKAAAKAAPAPAKTATKATTKSAAKAPARGAGKAAAKGPAEIPNVDPNFAVFLDEIQAQLLDERATYTYQADLLKAEADLLAAEREPGDVQFDEESGEGDTLAVERERDLALSAQARAAVDEIDAALAKIDAGTYGICEQCGQSIPQERLRAIPFAALCVQCKSMGLGRR